ncbi:helix-turn-helix domain-containing protein [Enterococcus malodoratus]|uniref:helix-turn-helix domain-containing protein n=1 Tax=Enterococcus malodoratus TaxID=71451 RepID=UPI002073ADEF|nr:helix-turn-helix transcriptional regulator [Enterococcus malodoratus]
MIINLKNILARRNMTISDLQKLTGISRSTLTPLSKTQNLPSKTRFDTIEKICKKLKISENELLEFSLPQVSLSEETILDRQSSDYLAIVKFSLDYGFLTKSLYFSAIGRYVYPRKLDEEDLMFKINHKPSYSAKIMESDKELSRYEKEMAEFDKLYEVFKLQLTKKYSDKAKLNSVHLSSLSEFDLEKLEFYNNELFIEICADKMVDHKNNINVALFDEIAKEFMTSSTLKDETFVEVNHTHGEHLPSDCLFISVNFSESNFSFRTELEYNKSRNEVVPFIFRGMKYSSAVTEAYKIKNPDDEIY